VIIKLSSGSWTYDSTTRSGKKYTWSHRRDIPDVGNAFTMMPSDGSTVGIWHYWAAWTTWTEERWSKGLYCVGFITQRGWVVYIHKHIHRHVCSKTDLHTDTHIHTHTQAHILRYIDTYEGLCIYALIHMHMHSPILAPTPITHTHLRLAKRLHFLS